MSMTSVREQMQSMPLIRNIPKPTPDTEAYEQGRSQHIGLLAAAMLAAQQELQPVAKDKENPFFNSRYADLGAVMEAAKLAYNKHGIVVIQRNLDTDGSTVAIETLLVHVESAEFLTGILRLKPAKTDPQGMGSCITYARRYALGVITGLVTEDDDDGNAASQAAKAPAPKPSPKAPNAAMRPLPKPAPAVPPPPPSEEYVGYLRALKKSAKLTAKGGTFGDMTFDLGNDQELTVTWFGFSEPWTFETLQAEVVGTDKACFFTVTPPSNPKYKPTLEHIRVEGYEGE